MSADVVLRKRGRPRKISPEVIIAEPIEAPANSTTTRKKAPTSSTKAPTSKATKPATTRKSAAAKTVTKAAVTESSLEATVKPIPKASTLSSVSNVESTEPQIGLQESSIVVPVVPTSAREGLPTASSSSLITPENNRVDLIVNSSAAKSQATAKSQVIAPVEAEPTTQPLPTAQLNPVITPATSNILLKVRELSLKTREASAATTAILESIEVSNLAPRPSATPSITMSNPTPKPAPKSTSQAAKNIPFKGLNSAIVGNISRNAGARGDFKGERPLPPNYKPVARKVTMTIVALPIAIVTSYVLYQRLVLGEERKRLVPDDIVPSKK